MSYSDSLRQQAKWIREALDPDFDPLMKITLDDIDIDELEDAASEIEKLGAFIGWVDSWVSNPVGSYSVYALDGLFRMTRDKLAALSPSPQESASE